MKKLMTHKEAVKFMDEFQKNYNIVVSNIPDLEKKHKAQRMWKRHDKANIKYREMVDIAIKERKFDLNEFSFPWPNPEAVIKLRPLARLGRIGYIYYSLCDWIEEHIDLSYHGRERLKNRYHKTMKKFYDKIEYHIWMKSKGKRGIVNRFFVNLSHYHWCKINNWVD